MTLDSPKSEFLHVLRDRGFIHQASDFEALDAQMSENQIKAYIGFDCTAPSLHVGSLVQIMMLFWLQLTGHCPITLMGGGTTRVGDPSGKDESRQILDDATIQENLWGIRRIFTRFLDFGDGRRPSIFDDIPPPGVRDSHFSNHGLRFHNQAMMVNNADWLNELRYIDFLRDAGRHFSVNRMLSFESVKLRLDREQELSFLEFNYMLLQAYDFVELYDRYGCILQMGGSDQWGNIVNGIELGRRSKRAQLFALTSPLITTSSGAKMGKTASGAIWLDKERTSPYDYYQFWRNTEDDDVGRFLSLFTLLPSVEIKRLAALRGSELNEAKKILAFEATKLIHGRFEAEQAAETARRTFEQGVLSENLPTIEINRSDLEHGLGILKACILGRLVASTSEARRHIAGRGLKVNDVLVTDERMVLTFAHLTPEGVIKLSLGRKKHVLVKPV